MNQNLKDRLCSQEFAERLVDIVYRLQTMGVISFDEWWKVFQATIKKEIGE